MQASGTGLTSRSLVPQMPKCTGCHSQDYVNCYSCHNGKDDGNVACFANQSEVESYKIGLIYPGTGLSEKCIVVRHEPSDKEVFDFHGKRAFKTFDSVPTWKRASPHNVQRWTWRNASCNHCHGQRGVFPAESDLLDYEKDANKAVVVPDDKIPAERPADTFKVPEVKLKASMVVKAEALHDGFWVSWERSPMFKK